MNVLKTHLIELIVIIISSLLYIIGILYSNDQGFYSREYLSSGGDDFDIFISSTKIFFIGIISGFLNLILNIILLKYKNKSINISNIIYLTIFFIQLFFLFLINLDTELIFEFIKFDLFSIWIIIYFIGTLFLLFFMLYFKKYIVNIEYIKIKVIYKILIIISFSLVYIKILYHNI